MKKIYAFLGIFSLSACLFAGCGTNTVKPEEANTIDTTCENVDETDILDETVTEETIEEVIEEDLSGIVPLSKRVNKGKMIAFVCVTSEEGFNFDSLDVPNVYINNKEAAYDDASKLLVK